MIKRKYKQGIYIPKNPKKWIITEAFDMNEPGIKYRSGWEKKFFVFCDMNDNIVKVNSEGIVIPYHNPVTNKISRYYVDVTFETKDGKVFLVEIKPYSQTIPPKPPKRKTTKSQANYLKAVETYAINKAKWKAAEEFAAKNNWTFKIITEKELGL